MQIGNLSRAPIKSRGIVAFQLLRAVIVVVFAAAGGYALSLSVEDPSVAQKTLAALEHNDNATAPLSVDHPDQASSVQVVSADSSAAAPASAGVPEAPVQESAPGSLRDTASAAPNSDVETSVAGQAVAAEPSHPEMTGAVNVASTATEPAADSDLVDLNKGSLEELNSLRNAGALGRAIIRSRPYASVEDLVKRQIVRRSVYEKIKDQVTVE
ncbi:helix-hairpin-helix domain-containing protein [Microvirga sp. ACRRW]|uniref:ComEA family DNA-binding protein n=1 Tax=Microvirga sp. ACRRW TaxID=2918205 RepID=UPI001EF40413|nr:helix-hairpin-helix domain-containing protein [Microvirga sp. ACRRW]MCG7392301.1 helix-hairpin-helix domain-containing protein [Microvirga sp. ACRRW]